MKIKLLKALALNYNIIYYYGVTLNKPILLLVDPGQTNAVISKLSSYGSKTLTEYDRLAMTKELIMSVNSGAAIFPYDNNDKAKELLKLMVRIAQTQSLNGETVSCVFFVVSEVIPYDLNLDDFCIVEVSSDEIENTEVIDYELLPQASDVPLIGSKIEALDRNWATDERLLFSVLECLKPRLSDSEIQIYIDTVNGVLDHDRSNKGLCDIAEAFVSGLYKWQEKECFEGAYELMGLSEKVVSNMDKAMFYNSEYVYVKDSMLKKICEMIFPGISYIRVKHELCSEGIIEPDRTDKTFTCNMGYETTDGLYQRTRMIRLIRNRLNKPGEMEFADLCCSAESEDK